MFLYPVSGIGLTHVCLLLQWLLLSIYLAPVGLWLELKVDTLILPLRKMSLGKERRSGKDQESGKRKRQERKKHENKGRD